MKPVPTEILTPADIKRFWKYVRVGSPNECWPWTAGHNNRGYGHFRKRPRTYRAHRMAFVLCKGDPGSFMVCHTCDNPPCCNPAHLFLGTGKDNVQDCINKGRISRGIKHSEATKLYTPRGEDHPCAILTKAQVDAIRRMWATGEHSRRDIAAAFGIMPVLVGAVIKGRCWGPNPYKSDCTPEEYHRKHDRNQPRGETHPMAKLTQKQVEEIRQVYTAGKENQYELAARFNVSRGLIGHITRGRIWK